MNDADDSTLLIAPRWIAPVEPLDTVLLDHAVVVHNGRIDAVLPVADAVRLHPAARSVALPGHLLVPGLVNLHTHAAMSLLRGAGLALGMAGAATVIMSRSSVELEHPIGVRALLCGQVVLWLRAR